MWGASRSLLLLLERWAEQKELLRLCCYVPGALAAHLQHRGHTVDRILDAEECRWKQGRTTLRRALRLAYEFALGVARVAGALRRGRVSVLYVNTMISATPIVAGRLAGVPTVVHMREVPQFLKASDRLTRLRIGLIRFLRPRFVANSVSSASLLQEIGVPRSHIVVVHNGVDLEEFNPARFDRDAERASLEIAPDRILVVSIARPSPDKGVDVLLEAASLAFRENPRFCFIVVGGPLDRPFFEKQLLPRRRELGLDAVFRFAGIVEDARPYLAAADLVAVASRAETFGRVNIEGMAMERPVVAAAVGGIPEIVADGVTGLLCTPQSPRDLAAKLLELARDPLRRVKMGRAGRQLVSERFSVTTYAEAVLNVLRSESA